MIRNRGGSKRAGLLLMDAACGLFILGAAGLLITNMIGTVARARRASDIRQSALQAAANQLERLSAQPWDQLTPGERELTSPPELSSVIPGVSVWARISEGASPDTEGLRQVEVEVRWPPAKPAHRPVTLFTRLGPHGRPGP